MPSLLLLSTLAVMLSSAAATIAAASSVTVVPGQVIPSSYPQSWQLNQSTAIMICNNSGRVDPAWASQWSVVDLDWNGDKVNWSQGQPMDVETDMYENMMDVKRMTCPPNGTRCAITWVYRNGVKALPW